MHIHVEWEGPFAYDEAIKLQDKTEDFGVYQIYGSHPVYGSDVLLYIGKADQQTLGKRLSQEPWQDYNKDGRRVAVYVGRLHTFAKTPIGSAWSTQITLVEQLLILAHAPAVNSSGLNVSIPTELSNVHVLNWGRYRDLLPEVSGVRFSSLYATYDGYKAYTSSDEA